MTKSKKKLDGVFIWCDEMIEEDFDQCCSMLEQTEIPFNVVVSNNPLGKIIEVSSENYFKGLTFVTNFLFCTYEEDQLDWMRGNE